VTKIVINAEHGGFGLSQKAIQKLIDEHGYEKTKVNEDGEYEDPDAEIVSDEGVFEDKDVTEDYLMHTFVDSVRADPSLVQVVEELGYSEASGRLSSLKVVEVPDDVDWEIVNRDGREHVAEKHRTWY
jgi:hypothetical protein